jgi:MFS family permease
LIFFGLFALAEHRRGRDPLIDLRLFTERSFTIGVLLVIVAYAGVNSFFLILSLTLQDGLGFSALQAGLTYTPLALAFFATSLVAARLVPRFGRRVLEVGSALAGIGFLATMTIAFTAPVSVATLMVPLIMIGLGNGLLLPQLLNTVLARIGPNEVGMASGVLSTGQQVGGALGVAVIGVLYFNALGAHANYAVAFGTAVVLNLIIAVIATALLFALPATRRA